MAKKKKPRAFSAKKRAKSEGGKNAAAERIEREQRERLAERYGEPVYWGAVRKDGSRSLRSINAHFFAGLFAADGSILWEPEEVRLYRFEEERGLWLAIAEDELLEKIGRFMLAESRRPGFEELEARLNMRVHKEILNFVRGIVSNAGAFKKEPEAREHVIHLENGVFPIRGFKLGEFSPNFRREYFSRNQAPVAYDPEADCPRFMEELLLPALPPETAEEDAELLFRFMGLFLLGVNLPQKFLLLDGAPESGKTQIANVIVRLIGERNVGQLDTEQLDDRFEYGSFVDKSLLYGDDVKERFLQLPGANKLKSLTGGGYIEARMKYGKENVSMRGVFNVLVTSNKELRMKLEDDSRAWRRRIAILRFIEHKPKKRIPDFGAYLFKLEGSGIFNRALAGLRTLLDDLEAEAGLAMTPAQIARVDALLERSEPLAEFLADRVQKEDGSALTGRELKDEFFDYQKRRGFRGILPSDRDLGKRLKELMAQLFGASRSNSIDGGSGYRGVCFKSE